MWSFSSNSKAFIDMNNFFALWKDCFFVFIKNLSRKIWICFLPFKTHFCCSLIFLQIFKWNNKIFQSMYNILVFIKVKPEKSHSKFALLHSSKQQHSKHKPIHTHHRSHKQWCWRFWRKCHCMFLGSFRSCEYDWNVILFSAHFTIKEIFLFQNRYQNII